MLQATTTPTTTAGQEALRAERAILSSQLQQLESTRRGLQSQLAQATSAGTRTALTDQLADVTRQIAVVDNMLARAQGQLAGGQATTTAPPRQVIVQGGPPEDALIAFGFFACVLLLPMSIAMTRRIWRRSTPESTSTTAIPTALDERLARIEQAVESTSIEVERIGEGQRFVTKLLTEAQPGARLAAPALTEKA